MAWYPGAVRMELQPESDAQPAITPTQFILHSVAAPWTKERIFEYWRDSTDLESHFGQSYDGSIAQYIGTQTRADANYLANRRADGTGAVSMETASNDNHTDPWTDAQIEGQIQLGVWLHQRHGIPLRICRTASDPGYGYHRLHADWAIDGTACPGDARVKQFNEIVFPGIVARADATPTPPPEPSYEPFPGAGFFTSGRRSPIIAAMHKRLVAVGCNRYQTNTDIDVWGSGDVASYKAWQQKLGYTGADADGYPGPTSWNKLQVPDV